ncbi:membrane protein of uknown function UCP014873 [Rippkaea orientalis PCC 8801]|uniref:Membrane protein of uknown function UCP014873 n=1 Tax=Rippkaea orientalis (strain PCC 8801 / RF-1) TaxID=41431 RepID=B7JXW7_RIPO1|nr:DUF1269 domain-containing protein [Rippkaea orientalis]ACK65931.1 membrane protein of uknown function UCP014873 [Rippkaea orientalis PCC 8801]
MAALTVWKFNKPEEAEEVLIKLAALQKEHIIDLKDAATVSWPEGKKKPKTKQAVNLVGLGALDGAFWGLLFGLLFFCPIFGIAVGASMGALGGSLRDYGINDDFINEVKSKVTEGTSALFLLTGDVTLDKVREALGGITAELIQSNLSNEQEAKLKEHFHPEA